MLLLGKPFVEMVLLAVVVDAEVSADISSLISDVSIVSSSLWWCIIIDVDVVELLFLAGDGGGDVGVIFAVDNGNKGDSFWLFLVELLLLLSVDKSSSSSNSSSSRVEGLATTNAGEGGGLKSKSSALT